ncbi:hypothetical protein ABK716_27590, partial [Enterobacter kobei]
GKNSLNRLIRCVCGKKIGPDPRNFNQRVSLGRNDLLIRTFPNLSFILNIPYNFLRYFLSHFERVLNEAARQWHVIFKNLVVLFQ